MRTSTALALVLSLTLAGGGVARAVADPWRNHALDGLRLDQVRMLGSHNSYRRLPSPAEAQRIRIHAPQDALALDYGHPPLESQLALGLHQFEIDVAPDPDGGLYAAPYADATPAVQAQMREPGAKVLHIAGLDIETHCLTLRACLGVFARWSAAHPQHDPVVVLINAVDPDRIADLFPHDVRFGQTDIDALDRDVVETIGRAQLITPDDVRGDFATLRDAVRARRWPRIAAARGRFLFILDGSPAHEAFLGRDHPSLRGRSMFGWFSADAAEAAVFNIQDPAADRAKIRDLVGAGFIVRTRSDAEGVEARRHDGARMAAALASGAQIVSTDYYEGAPDPQALSFSVDFGGGYLRCDEVTSACPPDVAGPP